jgi:nitroreductase
MVQDKYSRQSLLAMDPDLLRAVIRERAHHTVEGYVYRALSGDRKLPVTFGKRLRQLLDVWEKRGLPTETDDLRWAKQLLELGQALSDGKTVDLGTEAVNPFPSNERETVERAIYTRRSIRKWKEEEVPDELIKKVIEAGLWAPQACNLQTIRVIVMKGKEVQEVFERGDTWNIRIMLVICQDTRPYEFFGKQIPAYNRKYDCGAAVQNMLLAAHIWGLGAVWLTYHSKERDEIRQRYKLPDYLEISTFVALGWPAESPLPPGRLSADEVIIR